MELRRPGAPLILSQPPGGPTGTAQARKEAPPHVQSRPPSQAHSAFRSTHPRFRAQPPHLHSTVACPHCHHLGSTLSHPSPHTPALVGQAAGETPLAFQFILAAFCSIPTQGETQGLECCPSLSPRTGNWKRLPCSVSLTLLWAQPCASGAPNANSGAEHSLFAGTKLSILSPHSLKAHSAPRHRSSPKCPLRQFPFDYLY